MATLGHRDEEEGMDLRKLTDDLTDVMAQHLNYFDNMETLADGNLRYDKVKAAMEGGRERYMTDPLFRRKVQSLVYAAMQAVDRSSKTADHG